jgi:cadmium resistance protein CadD (predicted permease)
VDPGSLGQAVGLFAVTSIDDLLVLALFFGQAGGSRAHVLRIVAGQYLGFAAIVAVSIAGAAGAAALPPWLIPYLGVLPLVLGLRAGWATWSRHHTTPGGVVRSTAPDTPGVSQVAAVTFANGGDNIGVYVPVFTVAGVGGTARYAIVFFIGVAAWCAAGRFFATRPVVARTLSRWGDLVLPVVLIGIGLLILIDGNAFGL